MIQSIGLIDSFHFIESSWWFPSIQSDRSWPLDWAGQSSNIQGEPRGWWWWWWGGEERIEGGRTRIINPNPVDCFAITRIDPIRNWIDNLIGDLHWIGGSKTNDDRSNNINWIKQDEIDWICDDLTGTTETILPALLSAWSITHTHTHTHTNIYI